MAVPRGNGRGARFTCRPRRQPCVRRDHDPVPGARLSSRLPPGRPRRCAGRRAGGVSVCVSEPPLVQARIRFGTWLYRVVTNAALMHRRARTRRPVESLEAFLPEFDATGRHCHTPAELQVAARADELLDRRVLAEEATAALDRLPDLYRSAFVLRDLEELSTAEVAQVLGIEPATVRQRVHRARLMLRGYLGALAGVKS